MRVPGTGATESDRPPNYKGQVGIRVRLRALGGSPRRSLLPWTSNRRHRHVIMNSGVITFFVWLFCILGAATIVLHVLTIVLGLRNSSREPPNKDDSRADGA